MPVNVIGDQRVKQNLGVGSLPRPRREIILGD